MRKTIIKGKDPLQYNEAKIAAKQIFNGCGFIACKRKNAELAVTIKWGVKRARVKQRTYYFTTMY